MPVSAAVRSMHSRRYYEKSTETVKARTAEYYATHREQCDARMRDWQGRVRKEAVEAYGGRCACCGESNLAFLTFDHINGGGSAHRRKIKGYRLAVWLRGQGYPPGFQVLCYNCNAAKGQGPACPHQERSTS